MTLYEAVKLLVENEKTYCAYIRREGWHPRMTVYFDVTLGKDSSHFFKCISFEEENYEEDFVVWYPSIDDLIAADWVIKSVEEF